MTKGVKRKRSVATKRDQRKKQATEAHGTRQSGRQAGRFLHRRVSVRRKRTSRRNLWMWVKIGNMMYMHILLQLVVMRILLYAMHGSIVM